MSAPHSLDRNEAAAYIGVSPATIKRAKDSGHLPAKKLRNKDGQASKGKELYRVADLEAWFDNLPDA